MPETELGVDGRLYVSVLKSIASGFGRGRFKRIVHVVARSSYHRPENGLNFHPPVLRGRSRLVHAHEKCGGGPGKALLPTDAEAGRGQPHVSQSPRQNLTRIIPAPPTIISNLHIDTNHTRTSLIPPGPQTPAIPPTSLAHASGTWSRI